MAVNLVILWSLSIFGFHGLHCIRSRELLGMGLGRITWL